MISKRVEIVRWIAPGIATPILFVLASVCASPTPNAQTGPLANNPSASDLLLAQNDATPSNENPSPALSQRDRMKEERRKKLEEMKKSGDVKTQSPPATKDVVSDKQQKVNTPRAVEDPDQKSDEQELGTKVFKQLDAQRKAKEAADRAKAGAKTDGKAADKTGVASDDSESSSTSTQTKAPSPSSAPSRFKWQQRP